MWSAGTLTADTLVFPDGYPDWIPISRFLTAIRAPSWEESGMPIGFHQLGILLGVVGAILTFYFAVIYDTSVDSERKYISGVGYVGGGSVVNLGKQQNRLIGVIVGIAMTGIGIGVVCIPQKPK